MLCCLQILEFPWSNFLISYLFIFYWRDWSKVDLCFSRIYNWLKCISIHNGAGFQKGFLGSVIMGHTKILV